MTLSAEFSVNGDPDVQVHSVAYGATVSLAALSTEFRNIAWAIVSGSKSGAVAPTITLSGAPTGVTASFTQVADPGDGLGRAWAVQCIQEDAQGIQSVAYRVVGTLNTASRLPICADEGAWRDATHGWSQEFNQVLAAIGSVGTGDFIGPAGATSGHLVSFSSVTGKAGADSGIAAADVIQRAGGVAFAGNQSMGGFKLLLLALPTTNGDALRYPLDLSSAAVTAALSFTHGGTGLVSLGTAFQSLRVNAGATAFEFYTPSAGLSAPADPADDGKLAIAGSGNLTYALAGNAQISPTAAIVLSKLADGAGCSLVGNTNSSTAAHADIVAGTNGLVYLRRSSTVIAALLLNENCDPAMALAVSKLAVGTALQQLRVNAGATSLEYFSPPTPVVATDLTNANATKNISDGSQFTLPASTLAASTKTLTLGTSGTPELDEVIEVIVYSQSQNYVLANGGPLADTLYTVIAGTKRVLHSKWNGTDWRPAGKIRLT